MTFIIHVIFMLNVQSFYILEKNYLYSKCLSCMCTFQFYNKEEIKKQNTDVNFASICQNSLRPKLGKRSKMLKVVFGQVQSVQKLKTCDCIPSLTKSYFHQCNISFNVSPKTQLCVMKQNVNDMCSISCLPNILKIASTQVLHMTL